MPPEPPLLAPPVLPPSVAAQKPAGLHTIVPGQGFVALQGMAPPPPPLLEQPTRASTETASEMAKKRMIQPLLCSIAQKSPPDYRTPLEYPSGAGGRRRRESRRRLVKLVDAPDDVELRPGMSVELTEHTRAASTSCWRTTAIARLAESVRMQASVLGFNDTFFVTSLVVVFALALVFLLGKPQRRAKMAPGGH
jgi:hypothetical protein